MLSIEIEAKFPLLHKYFIFSNVKEKEKVVESRNYNEILSSMNLPSKDKSLGKMFRQVDYYTVWLLCFVSVSTILNTETVVIACLRHIVFNLVSEFFAIKCYLLFY